MLNPGGDVLAEYDDKIMAIGEGTNIFGGNGQAGQMLSRK
jgi:hypothetical protein